MITDVIQPSVVKYERSSPYNALCNTCNHRCLVKKSNMAAKISKLQSRQTNLHLSKQSLRPSPGTIRILLSLQTAIFGSCPFVTKTTILSSDTNFNLAGTYFTPPVMLLAISKPREIYNAWINLQVAGCLKVTETYVLGISNLRSQGHLKGTKQNQLFMKLVFDNAKRILTKPKLTLEILEIFVLIIESST